MQNHISVSHWLFFQSNKQNHNTLYISGLELQLSIVYNQLICWLVSQLIDSLVPKPKDASFAFINEENQKILKFKKLKPTNVSQISLKNDWDDWSGINRCY